MGGALILSDIIIAYARINRCISAKYRYVFSYTTFGHACARIVCGASLCFKRSACKLFEENKFRNVNIIDTVSINGGCWINRASNSSV